MILLLEINSINDDRRNVHVILYLPDDDRRKLESQSQCSVVYINIADIMGMITNETTFIKRRTNKDVYPNKTSYA